LNLFPPVFFNCRSDGCEWNQMACLIWDHNYYQTVIKCSIQSVFSYRYFSCILPPLQINSSSRFVASQICEVLRQYINIYNNN
jgi:hypothetical protein